MLKLRNASIGLLFALGLFGQAHAFNIALAASAAPAPITIPIASFTYDPNSQCFNGTTSVNCFSDGYGFAIFSVPVTGCYSISQPASVAFGTVPFFALYIDNVILDHGIDAVTNSNYVFDPVNEASPYVVPSKCLRAGVHTYQIGPQLTLSAQIDFSPPTLTFLPNVSFPAQSAGSRDPTIQPFASYSIWNTPIGSGAVPCANTDPACIRLRAESGVVNGGSFSMPVYIPAASDPLIIINQVWNGLPSLPYPTPPLTNPTSTSFTPASGGDKNMSVYDPAHANIFDSYNCTILTGPYSVSCSPTVPESVCDGDPGSALGGIAGLMRKSEVLAATYNHQLSYQLSKDALLPPAKEWQVQWPEWIIDGCDTGCYTGIISPGVTIYIPSTVNLSSIGLTSVDGAGVARALQHFGARTRATGGTSQFTLMCEQACDDGTLTTQMANIRTDMAAIVPVLSILENQSSTSVNGGGTPIVAAVGRINQSICP